MNSRTVILSLAMVTLPLVQAIEMDLVEMVLPKERLRVPVAEEVGEVPVVRMEVMVSWGGRWGCWRVVNAERDVMVGRR